MNWALAAGIFFLTMYAWTRAKSYGWRRCGDLYFIVLMSLFVFAGEVWYLTHKTIPWFFGAEVEMQNRSDFNPIVLLLLLGILGVWVLRWPLSKLAGSLNRTGKFPPISAVALSGFFLLCGGYMAFTGAAYNTKMSGDRPGHWAVNAERVVLAKATGFVSKILSNETNLVPSGEGKSNGSSYRDEREKEGPPEHRTMLRQQEHEAPEPESVSESQLASFRYESQQKASTQYLAANTSSRTSRQRGPGND